MIYLQSDDNIPHHFDVACVLYEAINSDLEYKLITYNDMLQLYVLHGRDIFLTNLFVGSVEFMSQVFNFLELSPRVKLNSNRPEELIKLIDAKERILNGESLFIKPKQIKLFTGSVYNKDFISSLDFPDTTEVIVCKPFTHEIISEFRCYIYKNIINDAIQDIKCYSGDPFVIPNKDYINSIIKENKDFPIAYTIDIGVLSNGENVVIEYNDMWSIGNYGLDNKIYLRLLKARYFEIIKKSTEINPDIYYKTLKKCFEAYFYLNFNNVIVINNITSILNEYIGEKIKNVIVNINTILGNYRIQLIIKQLNITKIIYIDKDGNTETIIK